MEKVLARIVNTGLAGEPENVKFQVQDDTLKIFSFSEVKFIDENGNLRNVSLLDNNMDQPDIQYVLNYRRHFVEVSFNENGEATLYF